MREKATAKYMKRKDGKAGSDGREDGEGTHFARAAFFGGETPALKGSWHLGRQAPPGSTTKPQNKS